MGMHRERGPLTECLAVMNVSELHMCVHVEERHCKGSSTENFLNPYMGTTL